MFWVEEWEDSTTKTTSLDSGDFEGDIDNVGEGKNILKSDFVFVIDESGSMSGSRIRNARIATQRFVGALVEDEQAGLVGFDYDSSLYQGLTTNHDAVNNSIPNLRAGGSTNTGSGLRSALRELDRNEIADRRSQIILLADGRTNRGPSPVGVARDAAAQDVIINTIGLGSGANKRSLRQIARETGGDFYQVSSSSDLPETFARVAEESQPKLRDSDGDGLPDAVEEMDLRMPSGGPGVVGEPLNLDPNARDTSGDGIPDNEIVDITYEVITEDGEPKLRAQVSSAKHHPARIDTTGDGLTDREQIEGWDISYTDSGEDTEAFYKELSEGDDVDYSALEDHLTTKNVTANPLTSDTDGDGVSDSEERELGTNPEAIDTTGDGITDDDASQEGIDPTLYDIRPPEVDVYYWSWDVTFELTTEYDVRFVVDDPKGLDEAAVLRKDDVETEHRLSGTRQRVTSEFETGAFDTIGDIFSGTHVTVRASNVEDRSIEKSALKRSDIFGEVADEFVSQGYAGEQLAEGLGVTSGLSTGATETAAFAGELITDPVGYVEGVTEIVDEIDNLDQIIKALPQSIERQQELNNPYDQDSQPGLYNAYRQGWYEGYVSYTVLEMVVPGGQLGKAVKGSNRFKTAVDTIDGTGDLRRAASTIGRAGEVATTPVRYARTKLSKGVAASAQLGQEATGRILSPVRSAGQQQKVAKMLDNTDIESQGIATSSDGQELLGDILARSDGPDAEVFAKAKVCNSPCDPIIEPLNRIQKNVDGVDRDDIEDMGVVIQKANRRNDIDIQNTETFIDDLERLSNQDPSIDGLDTLIKSSGTSARPPADTFVTSNFKGEVGTVTATSNVLDSGKTVRAVEKDIDTSQGRTDIDIQLEDGTSIEVKNIDYNSREQNAPDFLINKERKDLTEKLEKYSEESDTVVLATRGDPETAEIPNKALDEADLSDGTTVEFKNIDELDSIS